MNATTEFGLFVKLALAVIKGDDAEARAIKIQKKAIACLTAQIAAKEFHQLSLEEAVENAEISLGEARVNFGDLITDNEAFIRALLVRRQERDAAELALKEHKEEIVFLKEELERAKK